ncbi:MAG: putative ABC transport system permease protein [Cocleimonas sp.]
MTLSSLLKQNKHFWRLAEMRLLFLALLVAVIAVTSVGFFTDRADRAMSAQATQLLGGDMVLTSSRPIDKGYLVEAQKRGMGTAEVVSFPSMVSSGDKFQLAQIKAVSKDYPLHGKIETSFDSAGDITVTTVGSLNKDEVLADGRLFVALGINAGEQAQLGRSTIKLAKIIRKMPDQGTNAFQFAPKMIIPLAQLPATGLLGEGSRASYSYLFAGDASQVKSFNVWLKPKLERQERIRTLDDGLPAVQQALTRGQRFLKMASLLAVILAGAGIALSSYSLTRHEFSAVAVLKTMGASRRQILTRYLGALVTVAVLAAIVGVIIGYFIQSYLATYLQDFVGQTLPKAGLLPVFIGAATSLIMAVGFSAPHLLQLIKTSPIQILQRSNTVAKASFIFSFFSLAIAVFLLMWIQTSDLKLSAYLLIAVSIALGVFWLIALLMLKLIRKLSQRWPLPKANQRMALMVVVFGVGLFSLLLLTTLRDDLINRWQASLPSDAPNHFLINIQPNEVEPLTQLLAKKNVEAPIYPMVRGRLVEVNKNPISPDDSAFAENPRAQRLLIREFNLSANATLPEGNIIRAGEWFGDGDENGFSMEEGVAGNLGVEMGDSLTFDIAGQRLTENITSIRTVQWDSMKPNFFVLAAPSAFDELPRTFITSVHLFDDNVTVISEIVKQFPSVTDIDISAILTQVRELINKAAFAVQAIFLFTLVAGVVVLFSALQSQKALRRKEIAIYKTLGASRSLLRRNLLLEFAMIGGLAGFLAAVLALVAANAAAYTLFDLSPELNLTLIIIGTFLGASLVSLAGYINVRGLLSIAPVSLFR